MLNAFVNYHQAKVILSRWAEIRCSVNLNWGSSSVSKASVWNAWTCCKYSHASLQNLLIKTQEYLRNRIPENLSLSLLSSNATLNYCDFPNTSCQPVNTNGRDNYFVFFPNIFMVFLKKTPTQWLFSFIDEIEQNNVIILKWIPYFHHSYISHMCLQI